jgi:single-stranded DNA-specific DHH superfamily exonuclease
MAYSLKQAGEATGRSKPSILRAIQTGKISARKSELGEWEIEPAELHRVYPPVAVGVTRTGTPDAGVTVELLLMRQELAAQAERLTALQEERERERRQLTERISELRDQLARSEAERREKDRQLTALLTDQSGRGEKGTSVPDATQPPMFRFFKYLRLWRH